MGGGCRTRRGVGDFLYICCIYKQSAQASPPEEEGRENQKTANDSDGSAVTWFCGSLPFQCAALLLSFFIFFSLSAVSLCSAGFSLLGAVSAAGHLSTLYALGVGSRAVSDNVLVVRFVLALQSSAQLSEKGGHY